MNDVTTGAKVAYVKRQGQTRTHHCHWPGCDKQCPPAMWGCRPHWFALPKALRDRIWRTYRPGQEVNGTPSVQYVEAARAVQEWIHLRTTHEPFVRQPPRPAGIPGQPDGRGGA